MSLVDIFPLPNEARKLEFFIGEWTIEGNLTFEGKAFKVAGYWRSTSVAAGWGVLIVSKMEIEGLGAYEEVDVMGFDSGEKMFHIFSVTNSAATHDHKGKWLDDKSIRFLYEGLQEGKKYIEEIEVEIVNSKEFSIDEKDVLDGKVISTMNITLRK